MEERKIVELKMKFYEDELDDFLAMIYIMKSELDDKSIDRKYFNKRNNSKKSTNSAEIKCKSYERTTKPFLRFLHWISCRFHIPTLDGSIGLKDEFLKSDMTDNDYFQETYEFLMRSHSIKKVFDKDQIEKLTSHLCRTRDLFRPKKEERDIFLEAVKKFEGSDQVPEDMFDFYARKFLNDDKKKRDIRICYKKTISREEKYILAQMVFENVHIAIVDVSFDNDLNPIGDRYKREDGLPVSSYQMYVLTGYIMSDFNFSFGKIKTEEEHLERDKPGYIKPYRDYLASIASSWIKKANKDAEKNVKKVMFTPVRQKF